MDPVDVVRSVVEKRFEGPRAVFFAGSVAERRGTEFSDLDVVVVLGGEPAPYRETTRSHGWLVELFVHDDASLDHFFALDREQGVCTLARMMASGPAWTSEQIDYRRYLVTDALDDLRGAHDPDERDIVAGQIVVMVAELHLAANSHWRGRGKWLLRQLRQHDDVTASALMRAHREVITSGDTEPLGEVCDQVLAPLGGRLTEGFVAR